MRRLVVVGTWCLFSVACGDGGADVSVEVRTDYVPGIEFVAVRTHLQRAADPVQRAAARSEDYVAGVIVAELTDVTPGTYELVVSLIDSNGDSIAERTTRVNVSESVTAIVLLPREVTSECMADDACTAPVACASGRCVDGLCLIVGSDSECSGGEYCHPTRGCVAVPPDAGIMDAMVPDAGADSGMTDATVPADVGIDTGIEYPLDLVGYWPCDVAGANSIIDVTGNGHDGFCTGEQCPTLVAGRVGSACEFDFDRGQRGRLFDSPALRPPTFTIAAFVQAENPGTIFTRPLGTASANSYLLGVATSAAILQGEFRVARSSTQTSSTFGGVFSSPSTWHHLAATYDGTTQRIYFDGVYIRLLPSPIVFDSNDVWIGADFNTGSEARYLRGRIDELRFYDRALSDAEIAALAAM